MPNDEKREPSPLALQRGRAIIDARKRQKLSQEELAAQVGAHAGDSVSRESVSNWERGTVGEIERRYRLGLCKVLGFEERELLLDPEGAEKEFEMPLSREAKSIAHRWDDLPETVRTEIKAKIAETERILRTNPAYAAHVFPELTDPSARKDGTEK